MQIWADPLRIYYFLIMDDEDPDVMTPFQGFGRSWRYLLWAMQFICTLPGDVSERSHSPEQIAVQRIAGLRPLMWLPLNISALEALPVTVLPPCCALLTGQDKVAERVNAWQERNKADALHITIVQNQGVPPESFDVNLLRDYCLRRLGSSETHLNDGQKEIVAAAGGSWVWRDIPFDNLEIKGHNITIPNHMALARVGYKLNDSTPFIGQDESEYTDAVLESATAVAAIRHSIGDHSIYALGAPPPAAILFEPALFRPSYERVPARTPESAIISRMMKFLQRQRGLHSSVDPDFVPFVQNSATAQFVAAMRSEELMAQTLAVGLLAAQRLSPVVRLSPAVNHVFSSLSAYARHARANRPEARRKALRLFSDIQQQLRDAIGDDRLEFLSKVPGPIKIVSDAPIEWLPIDGLPLSFRRDCSRIPVTPGNLMMGQLVPVEPMSIPPEALRQVLVVSSFKSDDPLRNVLSSSLDAVRHTWEGIIEITHVRVSSVEEFKAALNRFDGHIMVFDGHGVANASTPTSMIAIGDHHLDVWSLRGEVRCPHIVILSACDTQGIDASTHATVGNGFIALGARTVVGTFLPVDGLRSAMFIARLMHRLAEYIPAAMKQFRRSIPWTDVISGMLRMSLTTEIISELVAPPGHADYNRIHGIANIEINTQNPAWFERLVDRIAAFRKIERESASALVQKVIATSDAIRYTQLGNPETIIVSDATILEEIRAARSKADNTPF